MRRIVLAVGVLAATGGIVAILMLPVPWYAASAIALVYCLFAVRELTLVARGNRACHRLEIDATGGLRVFGEQDCCTAATLEPGSMVLQRLAWLRFRTAEGHRHAELLRRKSARSHDWRRFQVIWRHLGAPS